MKAGAVARSSGSWMSTALGSDVYMGANEPVNSCGQICLLPTGRLTHGCSDWQALGLDRPKDAGGFYVINMHEHRRTSQYTVAVRVARKKPGWRRGNQMFAAPYFFTPAEQYYQRMQPF